MAVVNPETRAALDIASVLSGKTIRADAYEDVLNAPHRLYSDMGAVLPGVFPTFEGNIFITSSATYTRTNEASGVVVVDLEDWSPAATFVRALDDTTVKMHVDVWAIVQNLDLRVFCEDANAVDNLLSTNITLSSSGAALVTGRFELDESDTEDAGGTDRILRFRCDAKYNTIGANGYLLAGPFIRTRILKSADSALLPTG